MSGIEQEFRVDLDASQFYRSLASAAKTMKEPEALALFQSAQNVIRERVHPALRQLHGFLLNEYLPACPTSASLSRWPNGAKFYELLLRHSTTTNRTADEIHNAGLAEVARIRKELEAVTRKTGHSGTLDEFREKVRTDPQFYYKTEDELLSGYRATAKRIEP